MSVSPFFATDYVGTAEGGCPHVIWSKITLPWVKN